MSVYFNHWGCPVITACHCIGLSPVYTALLLHYIARCYFVRIKNWLNCGQFGTDAEISYGKFSTIADLSGQFGPISIVQKCLGSELSPGPKCLGVRSVCTLRGLYVHQCKTGELRPLGCQNTKRYIIWLSAMKFGMVRGLEMDTSFPNLLHFGQLLAAKELDS